MTGPPSPVPVPGPGPVVDVHAHAVPADLVADLVSGHVRFPNVSVSPGPGPGPGDAEAEAGAAGTIFAFAGGPPTRPLAPALTDAGRRRAWLQAQSIGAQVVGGWLDIFGYQLGSAEGADWSRLLTERLAGLCAREGEGRLTPLGTVPLQDPARAADLLPEVLAAGCAGVMVATRAGELELDDPAATPFWEAADDLGTVVYLHPGFGAASRRYEPYGLANGLARIEDSTVTLARLLYAGIPARYPRLRLVVAHGGGALPWVLGRLVRNYEVSGARHADPMESFARLYFDSVVFEPAALELLVRLAGPERVLLGSDYPFPIGDPQPRQVIERSGLSEADARLLLGGNAATVFGLPLPAGGDGAAAP